MRQIEETTLAALLSDAAGRAVWGIDARGRGGRVSAGSDRTDLWRVPVGEIVLGCVEGEPWKRIKRGATCDR